MYFIMDMQMIQKCDRPLTDNDSDSDYDSDYDSDHDSNKR